MMKTRICKSLSRGILLAAIAIPLFAVSVARADRPNVILIMVDDLGYHDLGCYGHPKIKTPALDKLAAEGIRLTGFYAGATVCTPSRMALMTACYPSRLGWEKGVVGYMIDSKRRGLSPKALTIAEVFKANGYRTGMVGKWHLGDPMPLRPHHQGFDYTWYIDKSNNQTKKIWIDEKVVVEQFENRLLSEQFTDKAIEFIDRNKDKPFFLYLPYTAPHFPLEAHPDWEGKSEFGVFGDVVEEVDHRIGLIVKKLEAENLTKKTIVVFLSDNGPEPGTRVSSAKPFRGRKWSAMEGGTRVPCIVRYPAAIPAGRESDEIIAAIDLMPTLATACGINFDKATEGSHPTDGVNVWPTLIGEKNAKHPRNELLYWHGSEGFAAIRVGDWKLFPKGKRYPNSRRSKPEGDDGPALFNLAEDIEEKVNLADQHPDRVKTMAQLAEKRLADIEKNGMPLADVGE